MDWMEIGTGPGMVWCADPEVFAQVGPFRLAYKVGRMRGGVQIDRIAVFRYDE
jgi:hypothetical protein